MMPELGKAGGPWNALELAVRPKALREDYRMRLSACISDLRPMAARSTSQPEINANFLTATWSINYTGVRPFARKVLRVLAGGPIHSLPPLSLLCWPRQHTAGHGQQPG